jgi:TonB family protein
MIAVVAGAMSLSVLAAAIAAKPDGGARPAPPRSSIFGRDTDAPPVPGLETADGGASDSNGGAARAGSLDKEIIRRIIRRHISEVRDCYEPRLVEKPALSGRILVRFTINAEGTVISSILHSSTMNEPAVENCTVAAVGRWQFPKPLGGGQVIVTYPFVLTPAQPPPPPPPKKAKP